MSDSATTSEVVMFMSDTTTDKSVCKEMMYTEFEAVLDGVVGLEDFASQVKKAAFVIVNGQLQAVACALFVIQFDKNGCADKAWNIPLRHLAEAGGAGPDMGAGPIRLACRSQCSVAWHQGSLWDPSMQPGTNTFVEIRDAINRNRLCLVKSNTAAVSPQVYQDFSQALPGGDAQQGYAQPSFQQQPQYQQQPMQQQPVQQQPVQQQPVQQQPVQQQPVQQQPVQQPPIQPAQYLQPQVQQSQMPGYPQQGYAQQGQGMPAAGQYPQAVNDGQSEAEFRNRWKALESEQRNKVAKLIKAQRLHIATLDKKREEQVAKIKYEIHEERDSYHSEIKQLRQQVASLHKQNMAVREQCESQLSQIEVIGGVADARLSEAQQHEKTEIDALTKKYENLLDDRVNEESAKLKEEIQLRDMELMYRHEVTKQLREELILLRKDKLRLVNGGADNFLERLEKLGVSFIVFHPGAGHLSIPLVDMAAYMDSPIAYAASKCLVQEDLYRIWVDHYDNPVCRAVLNKDNCCGERVHRIDVPSEYTQGVSDRCSNHKADLKDAVGLSR